MSLKRRTSRKSNHPPEALDSIPPPSPTATVVETKPLITALTSFVCISSSCTIVTLYAFFQRLTHSALDHPSTSNGVFSLFTSLPGPFGGHTLLADYRLLINIDQC
jgi:hypothetical protein